MLAHYEASGDAVGRWQTWRFIGRTYLDLGEAENARRALETAEGIAVKLDNKRLIAQTRYWIGQTCLALDDLDGAQAAFDSVYDTYCDDTGLDHAYARHGLGVMARRTGALAVADLYLTEAVRLAQEYGDESLEGRAWLSLAALRRVQGRQVEQLAAIDRAIGVFSGAGAVRLEVQALAALAQVRSDRGEHEAADRAWAAISDRYDEAELPPQDRVIRRH